MSAASSRSAWFELAIQVQDQDIDELGHVNNVVYLRWVQDAAVAHWRVLASPAQQAAVAWVVTRHEVDYKRSAMKNDSIIARTWVGTASALTFQRHTEILRAKDRKLLAKALTFWCPIDPGSGRPMQVGPEMRALVSVPEPARE